MAKTSEEIQTIVDDLTLEEKIRCCALYQDRFGNIPRYGIAYRSCDNPSGGWCDYFRLPREEMEDKFWGTCFPQAAAQGATWDPNLAYEIGEAQGKECKNQDVDIILRPGVNMKRSPLGGRNFEYYSEDPWLAAEMGANYINGVQSQHVAANLKHFVCNNQEYERMTTNAVVDERTFNELYLRVFQLILEKSDPWTIMSCYNKVNGKWVHQNPYIMNKLRKDFGYTGVVMSDAFAVHYKEDKVEGHICGLDVELAEEDNHVHLLLDAFNNGEISEDVLDAIAYRVIDCYYKIHDGYTVSELDLAAHHALAKRAALEGAVLLENDGVLPLDAKTLEGLAVIGAFAKAPCYMGGGSGHMNGHTLDIPTDEIDKLMEGKPYAYAAGYQINAGFPPEDTPRPDLIAEAVEVAKAAETIILFTGYPYGVESEGYDRTDLFLPKSQRDLLDAVLEVNKNVILVVNTGAPVDISAYNKRVKAVLQGGYAGEASGSATIDVLFGLAEPGGRLPETYPCRLEDTPAYLNLPHYPDTVPNVVYGEGLYIGYRWYDARKMVVEYPFGYGLSYTTFEYSDIRMDQTEITADGSVTVSFTVKNTGSRPGSDVAQVYVHAADATINRPVKELRGFKKVRLVPGEETTVSVTLGRRAFECYTPALHKWVVEGGTYEILVGRNSRDIKLTAAVKISSDEVVKRFSPQMQIGHFIKSPDFKEAIADQPQELRDWLDEEKNPVLPLGVAIPFGQFGEADLGQGKLSQETIQKIVKNMNHK
ncbi:MAG: glycoside hydrolase family 3 C-terminal domain-containing protein [Clostridiales bacterium]|nr:glycoside hydrolase family 3 C-terminal domain-containing protein [Clostridiales bacterium]